MALKNTRILLVADTHLGFDLAFKPKIQRRRRGDDFFRNFRLALKPALSNQVDLVVHGGDLLFRSKVPAKLVEMALAPLFEVADHGADVYLVPGNHERSRIPYPLLAAHKRLHIFARPKTFLHKTDSMTLSLSGFPSAGRRARREFLKLLSSSDWQKHPSNARLLCLHEAVEGATVGPSNYTFRNSPDTIRSRDIPSGLTAVLCGHIHRHQVLTKNLAAPVFYPGSVERTSIAEKDEPKGFITLEVSPNGSLANWTFHHLPARPMIKLTLPPNFTAQTLRSKLRQLDSNAIVRIDPQGRMTPQAGKILSAESLRALALPTQNVSVSGNWWAQKRRPTPKH
jgi:DNA repair exonuclease SbcCD nuclease subunit